MVCLEECPKGLEGLLLKEVILGIWKVTPSLSSFGSGFRSFVCLTA